jgi:hypothetical protein
MTPRRGLVWPLLLIVVGLAFLAANFGLIGPLSALALLSLWPLILIIVGIDIAIGRRWPGAALGADVLVIAIGVVLATTSPATTTSFFPFYNGGSSGPAASTVDVPRGTAVTLALRLSAGAGSFDLRGGTTSLVHAESDRDDLRLGRADVTGNRADVRLDQGPSGSGFRFGPSAGSHMTVQVANDVPTSLTIDAGAGELTVDTSDMKIADARISVGAASMRFVLPHPVGDVPITISAGASSIVIEVPADVEARITSGGGLNSTHFENSRFSGSDTNGYANAKDRVTIRISSGVSSIVIR